MLSMFVGYTGEIQGRSMGAAAVKVTKTLAWDRLATYFGEEMLIRRTGELMQAIKDGGMAISPEERAAVELAVAYATGNQPRPRTSR
jgi:hypothetical protein